MKKYYVRVSNCDDVTGDSEITFADHITFSKEDITIDKMTNFFRSFTTIGAGNLQVDEYDGDADLSDDMGEVDLKTVLSITEKLLSDEEMAKTANCHFKEKWLEHNLCYIYEFAGPLPFSI